LKDILSLFSGVIGSDNAVNILADMIGGKTIIGQAAGKIETGF
jgi:hypothetical protein